MHARVTTIHVQPGTAEEATHIFRDSIVPAAQQQAGFRGIFLLADPGTDRLMTVSFWENETDLRAGEANGYYQEQVAKVSGLMVGPSIREAYEVSLQTQLSFLAETVPMRR